MKPIPVPHDPAAETCCGCGAPFGAHDGPSHAYMAGSAACWAAYGVLLEREYSERARWPVHHLSVDSYAVQHPGTASGASTRSVWVHLISLCAQLERGLPASGVHALLARAARLRDYEWLPPPARRGQITVADVVAAADAAEHLHRVRDWAQCAWQAWSMHHAPVRQRVAALERARGSTPLAC